MPEVSPPSAAWRAFLMIGRGEDAHQITRGGTQAFLLAIAADPGLDPNQAYGGVPLLAAWLSNRPGVVSARNPRECDEVEQVARVLLARGADGCAGIEAWANGQGCPDLAARPCGRSTEAALRARAVACPLAAAFIGGHVGVVRRILDAMPEAGRAARLERLLCANGTPLLHAAAAHNPEMLDALLQAGAHCGQRDGNGGTPLHAAASEAAVRSLLAHGADPMAVDGRGHTCGQAWRRRLARGGRLDSMLALLPRSRQSMRDKVFLGEVSGPREWVEKQLGAEGCDVALDELIWTGIGARIGGFLGETCLPARRTLGWLCDQEMAFEGKPGGWQQCFLLLAAASLDGRHPESMRGPSADNDFVHTLLVAGWLDSGQPLHIPGYGAQAAPACVQARAVLAKACRQFPDDFPARLADTSDRILREGGRGGREDLVDEVFDMAGMALARSDGLGRPTLLLLQACLARWPGEDPSERLRRWVGAGLQAAERAHRLADPLDGAQARLAAQCLAGSMQITEDREDLPVDGGRDVLAMCQWTLPLWHDLLTGLHAGGEAAWEDAGGEVLARFDETLARFSEDYARAPGYADLMALRKALPDQRRLQTARPGRRRLA